MNENLETITNTTAVVAVVSPFWIHLLHDISELCATALPILGALWLVLQITLKLQAWWRGRNS